MLPLQKSLPARVCLSKRLHKCSPWHSGIRAFSCSDVSLIPGWEKDFPHQKNNYIVYYRWLQSNGLVHRDNKRQRYRGVYVSTMRATSALLPNLWVEFTKLKSLKSLSLNSRHLHHAVGCRQPPGRTLNLPLRSRPWRTTCGSQKLDGHRSDSPSWRALAPAAKPKKIETYKILLVPFYLNEWYDRY